jgi:hypothetical protein
MLPKGERQELAEAVGKERMMTRVVLDTNLRQKLYDLVQPLELCDENGKVLARLLPIYDRAEYGPLEPQVSDKELRRREQSTNWYTTEQVLAHLKELGQS